MRKVKVIIKRPDEPVGQKAIGEAKEKRDTVPGPQDRLAKLRERLGGT